MSEPHSLNVFATAKPARLEAFSDGVFAIAITLLVLDLKLPPHAAFGSEHAFLQALGALLPKYACYMLGFVTMGIFYMAHSTAYEYVQRADRNTVWLNTAFLFFISLMPFTIYLLSEYLQFRTAVVLYWLNILGQGLTLLAFMRYNHRKGYLREPSGPYLQALYRRIFFSQNCYALAMLSCFWNTRFAIGGLLLVQLNYVLPVPFLERPLLRLLFRK